jgi:hypothetical protein
VILPKRFETCRQALKSLFETHLTTAHHLLKQLAAAALTSQPLPGALLP